MPRRVPIPGFPTSKPPDEQPVEDVDADEPVKQPEIRDEPNLDEWQRMWDLP